MTCIKINTPNRLNYSYFPISRSEVILSVAATNDARVALRTHLGDDSNMYEIVFGACNNTMTIVKRNRRERNVAERETKDMLSTEERCDLWIRWCYDGLLSIGYEADSAFLMYKDNNPFIINFLGLGTANGSTGQWTVEAHQLTYLAIRNQLLDTRHYWVDCDDMMPFPSNAVMATDDGLFIGRAHHEDALTPGSVRGGVCDISWGGESHEKKTFQVLCGQYVSWVKSCQGSVPLNALPGGVTEDDHALFIGRVFKNDVYYIGKIQPNHQVCYVPIDGREVKFEEYETLVINDGDHLIEFVAR